MDSFCTALPKRQVKPNKKNLLLLLKKSNLRVQKVSIHKYSLLDYTTKNFVNHFIGLGVIKLSICNEYLCTVSVQIKKSSESKNPFLSCLFQRRNTDVRNWSGHI